jgi:hypothetical protein
MVFSGLVNKKWIILGLAGAILFHTLFNRMVVEILMKI